MANSICLLKVGGSVLENRDQLAPLGEAIVELNRSGLSLVLVHGGGKEIDRNLALLKETPQFSNGLRVTSPGILKMVEMTLSGQVNKRLVQLLNRHQARAVGMSGVDGPILRCRRKDPALGLVGAIDEVNVELIQTLLTAKFLPVISPISVGEGGEHYNVNADEAATSLAQALKAEKLIFLSDVPGVQDHQGERIESIRVDEIEKWIASEVVTGGMVPKLRACGAAVENGVGEVHICAWSGQKELLAQALSRSNQGTIVRTHKVVHPLPVRKP